MSPVVKRSSLALVRFGLAALALVGGVGSGSSGASEKQVIGAVEEVVLLPWGMRVKARVDTGAATSSVDARDIQIRGPRGRRAVALTLVGDGDRRLRLELPLVENRRIITGGGREVRRPVVLMEVCVAGFQGPVEVTLNDRARVDYRMLLGRNVLEGRFVVDVSRNLTAPPNCPAAR